MNYLEQEELVARILALAPKTSLETIAQLIKENWGITFTATNYRRAKARENAELVPKGRRGKTEYLKALFTLYPGLSVTAAQAKTRLYYGEKTRDDIVVEARDLALRASIALEVAKETIERVEAAIAQPAQLDLTSGASTDELEKPS